MLDNGTKKRIDSARDILVGKVPDPKSQVEQITIAMIYKFMDDMDNQTEELGGKATFFAGEFKQYAWSHLLDLKLSGHERLLLYAEGIEKMNINENIPQLFRDIFKGAFLPYRDPETLNLFLKEINGFTYDHSERLGDAFEYLLSVLSSQGAAGQFRTPRHIIDFMVEIANPAKEDTVLDPASGTAGFLISSYKHILRQNTKSRSGDLLTTDDKGRLMTNFCGYDISPDMVRLSLVNMYLHSFANPSIHEYDTLTSENRWDERYDVILANPPFMSPKGGIRPHSRFAINAKRSEVLFVDYIAEHLNVHGRAGVIVPEGIIFQSQNAYKNLRKMLVDEGYLYAVVSLPAGVFQPYSGVKTSILLMDKTLAKKTGEILFVKVSDDGFDLGAQRRPIDKNDLPRALKIVKAWKEAIAKGKNFGLDEADKAIAHIVSKEKISEAGDYNLSGDRYKEVISYANVKWPMVELGEVCKLVRGVTYNRKDEVSKSSKNIVLRANNIDLESNALNLSDLKCLNEELNIEENKKLKKGDLLICTASGSKQHLGKVAYIENDTNYYFGAFMGAVRCNEKAVARYLFYNLTSGYYKDFIKSLTAGVNINNLKGSDLLSFKIPLPPMEVQEKIVAELDGYQKIIDGAKQVVENYKSTIKINSDWPLVELGEVCENLDSQRIPIEKGKRKAGEFPYYGASGIVDYVDNYLFDGDYLLISEDGANLLARVTPIAFSVSGKIWVNNHAHILRFDNRSTQIFVECYINEIKLDDYITGSAQPKLSQKNLNRIKFFLPPLEIQGKIVTEIEAERELVEANKKLIEIFDKKIKDKIGEVWGE